MLNYLVIYLSGLSGCPDQATNHTHSDYTISLRVVAAQHDLGNSNITEMPT